MSTGLQSEFAPRLKTAVEDAFPRCPQCSQWVLCSACANTAARIVRAAEAEGDRYADQALGEASAEDVDAECLRDQIEGLESAVSGMKEELSTAREFIEEGIGKLELLAQEHPEADGQVDMVSAVLAAAITNIDAAQKR